MKLFHSFKQGSGKGLVLGKRYGFTRNIVDREQPNHDGRLHRYRQVRQGQRHHHHQLRRLFCEDHGARFSSHFPVMFLGVGRKSSFQGIPVEFEFLKLVEEVQYKRNNFTVCYGPVLWSGNTPQDIGESCSALRAQCLYGGL